MVSRANSVIHFLMLAVSYAQQDATSAAQPSSRSVLADSIGSDAPTNLPPTALPLVDARFLRRRRKVVAGRGGSKDDGLLQGSLGKKQKKSRALVRACSWGPMTARRKLGSLPPVLEERGRMVATA